MLKGFRSFVARWVGGLLARVLPSIFGRTDFTERQRVWLRAKFGIHVSDTHTSGGNRDWSDEERLVLLRLCGVHDLSDAPADRDFTDYQRSEVMRALGIPDCNTLTTVVGRDYTDKQRDHFLRLYGGPVNQQGERDG